MIAKVHMSHWYKVTDLGVELNSWLEVCSFYKVNFNLLHNLASHLLQDKPGWFSGKSCAVTIPYVEVNSTIKFALGCNEGLIMTLNSNKCAICMSRCLFLASQSLQRLNIDILTFTP